MCKNNNQSWQSWSKTSIILLTLLFWVTVFVFLSSNASAEIVYSNYSHYTLHNWLGTSGYAYGSQSKPTYLNFNFSKYDPVYSFNTISPTVRADVSSSLNSSSTFNLTYTGFNVGSGSVHIYMDGSDYLHEDFIITNWNTSFIEDNQLKVALSFIFDDSSIFDDVPYYQLRGDGPYYEYALTHPTNTDFYVASSTFRIRISAGDFWSWQGNQMGQYNIGGNTSTPTPESFINFIPNVNITGIKPILCNYTIDADALNYYYDNDTKRVGNTVEIMNGWTSYSFPELPTLWISEGFTSSNVSGNHTLEYCDSYNATYDIELRASWYELEGGSWLWHHGRDGLLLANDSILWTFNYTYPDPDPEPDPDPYEPPDPYDPPEIPPPPMPDDWNMTIPDKYQNVTWLTNYTTYFNEMGGTINTTLYSVSGWVISPLTSLNNTVYSLRYYIAGTHDMLNGLSHLHMIVNYGWAVIPIEIKTIFTGTAAIGVCIYLFKRRT